MSDALSDIAADQRRGRNYYSFLNLLTDYLESEKKDKELLGQIIETAKCTDAVGRGYWGGSTRLSVSLEERIKSLKKGDKTEWARLLAQTSGEFAVHERLKAISPFAKSLLVSVDYGHGFVTLKGELEEFFAKLIKNQKGWKTYDSDKYVVILPMPDTKESEIIWLNCGISGIKGPREIKK